MDNLLKMMQYTDPQKLAKVIALAVRNEIEDFHVTHLSDQQMKELNPLIRTAVYNVLFAFANYSNDAFAQDYINWLLNTIPNYWEDVRLSSELQETLLRIQGKQITFASTFLSEQYGLGNIYFVASKSCIQLRPSFDFIDVLNGNGKKHKSSITYHLKREGYVYDHYKEGYVKQ